MDFQDIKYAIQDFRPREWMNENQLYVAVGVGAIFLICISLVVCQFTGGRPAGTELRLIYFNDTDKTIQIVEFNTSEGFPGSPLEGTTDVYEAALYACDECPEGVLRDGMTVAELEEAGLFIGWLQKREQTTEGEQAGMDGYAYTFRHPEGEKWYTQNDPSTARLQAWPYEKCAGARPCGYR